MKLTLTVAVAVSLAAAGCGPTNLSHLNREFFLKQGVTYDRYERDILACANQATSAAPNSTQVGWMPYVGIYSYDPNDALRAANLEVCMRDKGYTSTAVPHCDLAIRDSVAATGFGRKDALSQRLNVRKDSCYVNNRGVILLKA